MVNKTQGLTLMERKTVEAFYAVEKERGVVPSHGEIAHYLGNDRGVITRRLAGLVEKGYLKEFKTGNRNLKLTKKAMEYLIEKDNQAA